MVLSQATEFTLNIGTILGVIGFFIYNAVKLTSYKDQANYRTKTLEDKCKVLESQVAGLINNHNDNALVIMEIKTKLANIESLLMELKKHKG